MRAMSCSVSTARWTLTMPTTVFEFTTASFRRRARLTSVTRGHNTSCVSLFPIYASSFRFITWFLFGTCVNNADNPSTSHCVVWPTITMTRAVVESTVFAICVMFLCGSSYRDVVASPMGWPAGTTISTGEVLVIVTWKSRCACPLLPSSWLQCVRVPALGNSTINPQLVVWPFLMMSFMPLCKGFNRSSRCRTFLSLRARWQPLIAGGTDFSFSFSVLACRIIIASIKMSGFGTQRPITCWLGRTDNGVLSCMSSAIGSSLGCGLMTQTSFAGMSPHCATQRATAFCPGGITMSWKVTTRTRTSPSTSSAAFFVRLNVGTWAIP